MAKYEGDRSLEETPTWAVAIVCAVFVIVVSILIEHGIHSLGKWFQKRQNKAMIEALEKIKAELMLLGFLSLLLTVGTTYISQICIPIKLGNTMLPCEKKDYEKGGGDGDDDNDKGGDRRRKLLSYAQDMVWHRVLEATDAKKDYCGGKVAFFRQFFGSVSKVDYMTMRHGFINAHFAPNSKFDFHKYIKRSMEDDFKVVVGISIQLWIFAVILLLLNVYSWYTLAWISLVPLVILLLVGTKLEIVIMEMAHQIQERTTVVRGAPIVEPSNSFFWFNRPQWILILIHFTLFQNAFQMALFLWTWYEFGLGSCFHENLYAIVARVVLGLALQFVCSYITFPLYALVTQMGSHMKRAIFEEQTAKALKNWHKAAKERKKLRKVGGADQSVSGFMSGENTPSHGSSPMHLLHKYKSSTGVEGESVPNSPRSYLSDTELSETEISNHGGANATHHHHLPQAREGSHNIDFSFDKP
ncbi:seven transmembrane MLO family protein [Actinidia rufa]|uniref:MLO-like protein n=1 Tax=Actinidia rufa TaxID=165716 RepID=A0A7J0GIB2_9ERIC|nr:seven transmembrane MLO family protein [Actinidia rufa]